MQKYWMVHRPGSQGTTRTHDTFDLAAKEARRLTLKELTRFVIMESVASYEFPAELTPVLRSIGAGPDLDSGHTKTAGPVGLDGNVPDYCRAEEDAFCLDPDCDCAAYVRRLDQCDCGEHDCEGHPEPPQIPSFCRSGFCTFPDCNCEETESDTHPADCSCSRCQNEPEETGPQPAPEPEEREECGCFPGHHTCPEDRQPIPKVGCPCGCTDGEVETPEPDYHTARGSGAPGCSCYWCDPENHDTETCEFRSCGCKALAHVRSPEFLRDLLAEALKRWPAFGDFVDVLPPEEVLEGLIPKVDCLCGCMDDEEPEPEEACPRCGFVER